MKNSGEGMEKTPEDILKLSDSVIEDIKGLFCSIQCTISVFI
jgi:hypothetical protein